SWVCPSWLVALKVPDHLPVTSAAAAVAAHKAARINTATILLTVPSRSLDAGKTEKFKPVYERRAQIPTASDATVSGTPALAYSQNDISTSRRARSITIRFATDPTTVRFPASVDDIASVSHACAGSASLVTNPLNTSTAGALLT